MKSIVHKTYVAKFDKERVLSYDLNALATIEDLSGKNIFKILKKLDGLKPEEAAENLSFKDMRILLYAGLKSNDASISIEEAGKLAGIGNIAEVLGKIITAFNLSMPEAEGKKK